MAVTFDLFGTLVDVDRPADPAVAVARELRDRGVDVPEDWADAYRERHVDAPDGAAVPLPAHVSAALASRGVDAPGNAARRAVVAAFDPEVRTREGAAGAVATAADRGPVGVLSNVSVPGLARQALVRADVDRDRFDAVVTSVGCGWRKPDRRAFAAAARALDADLADLVHVGDDERTDGGPPEFTRWSPSDGRSESDGGPPSFTRGSPSDERSESDGGTDTDGATVVLLDDVALADLPEWLEENR